MEFITSTILFDVRSKNMRTPGSCANHRTFPKTPAGEFSCSLTFEVFTPYVRFPSVVHSWVNHFLVSIPLIYFAVTGNSLMKSSNNVVK